ncbi:MAG: 6,7-dimethyl-8-ribityllumazine synthase [Acidobacteria bacterium]|nr:6,7-dimethyl-8-ribityllumazine synthase [Acidobacteriota bacterium]
MRDRPRIDGCEDASGLRLAIVMSAYHAPVTEGLRDGALAALARASAEPGREVPVITVPGAFELPLAARRAAESGAFDALVCLGCVVRGETPHFDYIASAVAHGIMSASQETGVPITFGVLTTNTLEEALARARDGSSNKGWEAAMAAVQFANTLRALPGAGGVAG